MTNTLNRVRMSSGKFQNINAIADEHGVIRAAAMDQRGSLRQSLEKARGGSVSVQELAEFKSLVAEVLTPYASAILLDPEFGLPAIAHRAPGAGVLLAYEKTGYDANARGRLPDLLPQWSALRLAEAGANAVKILLYFDPDDVEAINLIKFAFVERIGAECRANDIPFFLEPLVYSDEIGDEKGFAFARAKPEKVRKTMALFSQPRFGVDVLKVEVPFNVAFVEGSPANKSGQVAYSRKEALQLFSYAAEVARLPFIYLSAGVSDDVFRESLLMANEAGVPYSGVLCGRATWQDGIPVYAKEGATALRRWLQGRGVQNVAALNEVLAHGARPWWEFYGGKDNITLDQPLTW